MGRRIRVPLRVLLACLAVSLAAPGAVAIGIAELSAANGYLTRQADDSLRACARGMLGHTLVTQPGAAPAPPGACGMELLSAGGQVLNPAAPATAGPAIRAGGSWLIAHLARPLTMPAAGTSGRWRVVIEAVHYQARHIMFVYGPDDVRYLISGQAGHGASGLLVVMTALAGTGPLAAGYAAAAGTVLVLLAMAVLAVARAILRQHGPPRRRGG